LARQSSAPPISAKPGVAAGILQVTGIGVGRPGPFIAVAVLGAIVSVPPGYAYVILIVCLRRVEGRERNPLTCLS